MNEINLKKKGLRASYLVSKIAMQAKPSSSIKIFEKVVEPILMYNCEVSLAYVPKSWNYDKFKNNMWNVGDDVNKVVTSFLRQLLGVHKKTSNLAIFSETGKYPLSLKIFIHILKYWFRVKNSDNVLLKASKEANLVQDHLGLQNWHKMIRFLLKATELQDLPSDDVKDAGKIISLFKQKIRNMYNNWWSEQMTSIKNKKLNFFYQYKKTFKFEQYLDILPRQVRKYMTRVRTSSHIFPIEVLRYRKPKVEAQNRKCTICTEDRVGDEYHYLFNCSNENISNVRENFITDIRQTIPIFDEFDKDCIIEYCLLMHDQRTLTSMANYVKSIYLAYAEELEEKKVEIPTKTRSGRTIKKPDKL